MYYAAASPLSLRGGTTKQNDVAFDGGFGIGFVAFEASLPIGIMPSEQIASMTCLVCTVIARRESIELDYTGAFRRSNLVE